MELMELEVLVQLVDLVVVVVLRRQVCDHLHIRIEFNGGINWCLRFAYLFGIAGAALDVAGGGGGPRFILPNEPCWKKEKKNWNNWINEECPLQYKIRSERCNYTCWTGAAFLGPPGLGGDSLGFSPPLDSQSFLTGGGTGVVTVAIETSPEKWFPVKNVKYFSLNDQFIYQ